MLEENGSEAATVLLCLMACTELGTSGRWSICQEKDKTKKQHGDEDTTGGNV